MNLKQNHPLAALTTFNIGGPAEYYIEVKTKEELLEVLAWAEAERQPLTILGGGSNVLISDEGIRGLTIRLVNDNAELRGERIIAGAGAPLAKVLLIAKSACLSGLEWSHGIPRATAGGAVRGNAEAFGQSMGELVETAEIFDLHRKKFERLSRNGCHFAYRQSLFKARPELLVWEAELKLKPDSEEAIARRMQESIEFRLCRYPRLNSAGSVFENMSARDVEQANPDLFEKELKSRISRLGQISAGLIIDLLGLKGKAIGGAKVSLEHANHIVNTGHATADEVVQLISFIKQQARDRFGLQLREEVQYLGFD